MTSKDEQENVENLGLNAETTDGEPSCQDLLAEQQRLLEEIQGRYTRLAADFENYKKRTERQSKDLIQRANKNLICGLLPIVDNFAIALGTVQDPAVLKGIKMIHDQMVETLENEGLVPIASVGCVFDPNLHEAAAYTESQELDDHIIVEEIRRGYMLGGQVIRPGMVKVNIKKEE